MGESLKEKYREYSRKKFSCGDIINCLIWLTICMIPLIKNFNRIEDAYSGPKFEFLITMGTIILILMLFDRKVKLNSSTKLYLVFFGIVIISTYFAFDVYQAIRGYWERWEGLIAFFMYGVMFIAASNYLKINKLALNIFKGCGLIVTIIAILQGLDIQIFNLFILKPQADVISTIGNRNFISSYLIILLGITMSSFILKGRKLKLINTSIFFIGLVITKTRGGWVTLALIYLILMYISRKEKVKIKRGILIAMMFIGLFFTLDYVREGEFTGRLNTIKEDIVDFDSQSGSGRIAIYEATLGVIAKHPILGMGPDNLWFGIDIYTPEDERFFWQNNQQLVSKAHNEVLHIAATLGIPAAIIYLMIIYTVLKKIWDNIEDDNFKILFICILGYVIQANLNISVIDVATVFWVILGVGSNPEIIQRLKEDKEKMVIS